MRVFPFSVVVFDLDGTLVDTAPDLTRALNFALARLGRAQIPAEEIRAMVGHGTRNLVERALRATGAVTPAAVDQALAEFLAFYEEHLSDESRPYPGVEDALAALTTRGVRLAVCTNKNEQLSRKLLAAFGWTEFFAGVVGGDTLPQRKPDPAPLRAAIELAGGGAAALVGDSVTDVQTAAAAGIPCLAVTFGYRDLPAEQLGATALIHRFEDLIPALEELPPPSAPR